MGASLSSVISLADLTPRQSQAHGASTPPTFLAVPWLVHLPAIWLSRGLIQVAMFIFRTCGFGPYHCEGILITTMPNLQTIKARYSRPSDYCSLLPSNPYLEAGFDSLIPQPISKPVSLLAIILSIPTTQCLFATYCLPHNTFNEYYPCQQRLPEWRPNQPQQSRQSSRPPKLKRATRCTGDRAQVGTSVSVTIITCSCNIIRLLHLPITQKEVRRRQGDL